MSTDFLTPAAVGGFARLMLWMLIVWTGVQLGGGLYEKRAVIPLWSADPSPETLSQRISASGHAASSMRFWPYVSPVVFLLAIINVVYAWKHDGPARPWWLSAAFCLVVISTLTYAYFVPTMLSLMHRANTYTAEQLSRTVTLWLTLSNVRLLLAIPALLSAMKALTLLGGRAGWRL